MKKKTTPKPAPLVERVPIGKLKLDPGNARQHPERNMEAITASLKRFGQQRPVVAQRNGTVLAGNGLLAAARALGWKEVVVRWTDLKGADATAYAIADNRTSELAEWNLPVLKDALEELDTGDFDMDATGFSEDELEKLMTQFHVDGIDAPELKDGDRSPYRQMAFILHDTQQEVVEAAIKKAKASGGAESAVNENSNGNALAWIAAAYNG